jgi:hypothetical protein
MRNALLPLFCLLSAGCVTERATHGEVTKELATDCAANCAAMDMKLAAMVIIKSSAGCVCEPKEAQARAKSAAVTAAGGAIIAEEEEASRQQQANAASAPPHH